MNLFIQHQQFKNVFEGKKHLNLFKIMGNFVMMIAIVRPSIVQTTFVQPKLEECNVLCTLNVVEERYVISLVILVKNGLKMVNLA